MTNLEDRFRQAERAFTAGRLDEALSSLVKLLNEKPSDPAFLHLLALTEKGLGDLQKSEVAFRRALTARPCDPEILGNYANLLLLQSRGSEAVEIFDRVIALFPDFVEAHVNRALALQRTGRFSKALSSLDDLLRSSWIRSSLLAKVHSARGGVLYALGRAAEATKAFERALALEPARTTALRGRARAALESGDVRAPDFYVAAQTALPNDLDVLLGLAEAFHVAGDVKGQAILRRAIATNPSWVSGHESLAAMRSEAADPEALDHYVQALQALPYDSGLHLSYWNSLARAERYDEALAAIQSSRSHIAFDAALTFTEASIASSAGDPERSESLLTNLPDTTEILVLRGQNALQTARWDVAADLFQRATGADRDHIGAWAYLSLAWRMLGDRRADWLAGHGALVQSVDLPLDDNELLLLAQTLRTLHVARAHPIGQSLRGGTQTRGALFSRSEHCLQLLRRRLEKAISDLVARFPSGDELHPLLRHRETTWRITGSWSARFRDGGHHVPHIHSRGLLSSAFYVAVPEEAAQRKKRSGWLEIGGTPDRLTLPLPPIASFEPRPGRLVLFPSYLFHATRPFSTGERLTVAFDASPQAETH